MIELKKLKDFRNLKISKKELLESIPFNPPKEFRNENIVVCQEHVILLLERYKAGKVSEQDLLDWVNTIWFSDWYDYCDEYCDSIASVMDELEEIDEEGKGLTPEKVETCLNALRNNLEMWKLDQKK